MIVVALYLLLAGLIPPFKYIGASGFMKNWDRYIEHPSKRLRLPKFIRGLYDTDRYPVNIITYFTFVIDIVNRVIYLVVAILVLVLDQESAITIIAVASIVYFAINLPIGVARTVIQLRLSGEWKKNGEKHYKLYDEYYSNARVVAESLAHDNSPEMRALNKSIKQMWEIETPFLKEFGRCLRKKRGVDYLPNEWNVLYVAAYIKELEDIWETEFPEISERPDILGSLYNLGHEKTPHSNPKSNWFSVEVDNFYDLMGDALK